jgi:hypothetical protein
MAIPDDRPLTAQEVSLMRWMLEHGTAAAAKFVEQLAKAHVVSRCYCGCASIDLAIRGVVPSLGLPISVLADFEYRTTEGALCGAFLFERAGLLAGLEVWSVDGLSTPSTLPEVSQLQPLVIVRPTEQGPKKGHG